uniref:Uncharacterized protein n=1 Tax=Anopheles maculatus TaxID=74869 RepID=A0A182SZR0_9DIPT
MNVTAHRRNVGRGGGGKAIRVGKAKARNGATNGTNGSNGANGGPTVPQNGANAAAAAGKEKPPDKVQESYESDSSDQVSSSDEEERWKDSKLSNDVPSEYWHIQKLVKYMK